MIRINVTITVSPAKLEEILWVLDKLSTLSQKEEGCIEYGIYQNTSDKNTLMIKETWQNKETLDLHGKTPHFTEYVPRMKQLAESTKTEKFDF